MPTAVLSASRPGAGSAVASGSSSGAFQVVGVGTVKTSPAVISLAATLSAISQAAGALTIHGRPRGTKVLSASRPGAGSAAVTLAEAASIWDGGASTWDTGGSTWDGPAADRGVSHIVGVGIIAPLGAVPGGLTLSTTLQATSQARGLLVRHIMLAGQIGATSRGSARLPRTTLLAGSITAQAKAQMVTAATRPVMQGALRGMSSGRANAIITFPGPRPRQTEVSIIS
jgi:hypothetical protein